jgi:hypothetical protein
MIIEWSGNPIHFITFLSGIIKLIMSRYLVPLLAAGGKYGATLGSTVNIIRKIKEKDPNAVIHFSGVSSGAICAVMTHMAYQTNRTPYDLHDEFVELTKNGHGDDKGYYENADIFINRY